MAGVKVLGSTGAIECGKEAATAFGFANGYRNLNHGRLDEAWQSLDAES